MSSRGASRSRGGNFNPSRRGGSFESRGGRGGFQQTYGPPAAVLEMGSFVHACEGEMLCQSINPKIPYFNAPIYLENKTAIGKVDEVLGPINQVYFTIKPQEGILATSFKSGDKFFIGGDKLLPLEKFLPRPKPPPGAPKPKRTGGASKEGRGAIRGSRGGSRGRGQSSNRGGRGGFRGGGGRGSGFSSGRGGRGANPNFARSRGGFRGRGS